MPRSKRPSDGRGKRCARRAAEAFATAALLALGACAAPVAAPPPAAEPAAPGTLPRREPDLRVGILVDTTSVEIGSPTGLELVRDGRVAESFPGGTTLTFTSDPSGRLQYRAAGGSPRPGEATTLTLRPRGGDQLTIGGKPYRGAAVVRVGGAGKVTAINQVDMETYLLGVVPREIGTVGPELLEAAKAQAVAARTYAVKYIGRRASLGFDVYATVADQVYGGVEAEHDPVSRAVRETAGEIMVHQGEPIEAYYHSTCAGRTAAIEEVWPQDRPRPYLVSVVDVNPATGLAFDSTSSRFRWTERWTPEQFNRILAKTLADSLRAGQTSVGEVRDMRVLERTQSGRIRSMRITTSTGDFTVGGDRIRWIFETPKGAILNSSKFDVQVVRDAQGRPTEIVATGQGWGHGIGMCQVGAMGRARAGQGYRTILTSYYPGVEIRDLY